MTSQLDDSLRVPGIYPMKRLGVGCVVLEVTALYFIFQLQGEFRPALHPTKTAESRPPLTIELSYYPMLNPVISYPRHFNKVS